MGLQAACPLAGLLATAELQGRDGSTLGTIFGVLGYNFL